jgi:hypothetical protein
MLGLPFSACNSFRALIASTIVSCVLTTLPFTIRTYPEPSDNGAMKYCPAPCKCQYLWYLYEKAQNENLRVDISGRGRTGNDRDGAHRALSYGRERSDMQADLKTPERSDKY